MKIVPFLLCLLFSVSAVAQSLSAADKRLQDAEVGALPTPNIPSLYALPQVRLGVSGGNIFDPPAPPDGIFLRPQRSRDLSRIILPSDSTAGIPVDGSASGTVIINAGPYRSPDSGFRGLGSVRIDPNLGGTFRTDEDGNFQWCPVSGDPGADLSGLRRMGGNCFDQYPVTSLPGSRDVSRDLGLCSCLDLNRGRTVETLTYDPPEDLDIIRRREMGRNLTRVNNLLQVEQNAMSFQASTLPPANDDGGNDFISAYTRPTRPPGRFNAIKQQISRIVGPNSETQLTFPSSNKSNFAADDQLPPSTCLPYRAFLYQQMLPSSPEFIDDLRSQGDNYQNSEWDINILRRKFLQLSSQVTSMQEALGIPEAAKIFRRMQFLQRNPMIKNLFAASEDDDHPRSGELKDKFFKLMKRNLTVDTFTTPAERFSAFQGSMRRFFSGSIDSSTVSNLENFAAIRDLVQDGADNNMRRLLFLAPNRVQSVTSPGRPEQLWYSSQGSLSLLSLPDASGTDIINTLRVRNNEAERDASVFARYCPKLRFSLQTNQWNVFRELEDRMSGIYPPTPVEDPDYLQANSSICLMPRTGPGGQKTFGQYLDSVCPAHRDLTCPGSDQGFLVSEFLRAYPNANPSDAEFVTSFRPFINGEVKRYEVSSKDQSVILRNAGEAPSASRVSNIVSMGSRTDDFPPSVSSSLNDQMGRREILPSNATTLKEMKNSLASTSNSAAATSATNNASANATGPSQFVPVAMPDQVIVPPVAETEKLRTKVRESDSEITKISDQISTLREDMTRSSQAPGFDQNSSQYRDLMERMNSLEASITREREQNSTLRRQLAQAEARSQTPSESTVNSGDSSRGSSAQNRAPASEPTPGTNSGVSSGAQAGNQLSGQAQVPSASVPTAAFSPVTSFAQATRVSGGQLNTALLSKYNVQSINSQGSIIVADPNPSIDLQQLRSDSSEQVLRLTLSEADSSRFSQDEGQALASYMNQLRSSPGEVVRVLITLPGSSEPVERFVLKSQGRISIVPPPAPASRAPASGQRFRLSDLVNELQTSR